MKWPYPGLPAATVAEFTGHKVTGLPLFAPQTATTDHAAGHRNHHPAHDQHKPGCHTLPTRTLRPTDKQTTEQALGSIHTPLFKTLPDHTGINASNKDTDPESNAILTIKQMKHVNATSIIRNFTDRILCCSCS
ncbi:hypothetical protein AB0D57_45520 [Streptomyces sp. NPDC048275]|uniref:hypothetical protein n=1 Tax=Streptomyces sp. NPDC048275 TaxID=3155629 RepID=UPI0033EB250C